MKCLGFDDGWISKVMTCVTLVFYTVLVNGQPGQKITPTRGFRQGDLISPYLYFICAKGFSILLHDVERALKIKGIKMVRNSPTINNLFFTNDNIIFCRAFIGNWN